jgi:very-short-patch-repair endonuclease
MISNEETLLFRLRLAGIRTEPATEIEFHPKRKWRFDFAWVRAQEAIEIEGVTDEGGRHQRKEGFRRDAEKYAAAMSLGWRVWRFTPKQIQQDQEFFHAALPVIRLHLQRFGIE